MRITRRSDGKVFEFYVFSGSRGNWAYVCEAVDGEPTGDRSSCGPHSTERECRKAARLFAERARYDQKYGWVN